MEVPELCLAIEEAFAGVTLEDGIGLWQAQGIDDFESEEKRERLEEFTNKS